MLLESMGLREMGFYYKATFSLMCYLSLLCSESIA